MKKQGLRGFPEAFPLALTYSHMMTPALARSARPFIAEVKFVVDGATGRRIREWARTNLDPDPHGAGPFGDEYGISSLYFDTDAGDVFHRRGSFGRAKYRVRRYGESEVAFLERKLRKPGMLSKRRTVVALEALPCLNRGSTDLRWEGDWFHRRLLLRQQKPVCQILVLTRRAHRADHRRSRAADARRGRLRRVGAGAAIRAGLRAADAAAPDDSGAQIRGPPAGDLQAPGRGCQAAACARLQYRLGMTTLGEVGFPLTIPPPPGLNVPHG